MPRYVRALLGSGASKPHVRAVVLGAEPQHSAKIEDWRLALQKVNTELEARTWREAARGLASLANGSGPPAVWARQVRAFLQETNKGRIFEGLGHLEITTPGASPWRFRPPPPLWFRSMRPVGLGSGPVTALAVQRLS